MNNLIIILGVVLIVLVVSNIIFISVLRKFLKKFVLITYLNNNLLEHNKIFIKALIKTKNDPETIMIIIKEHQSKIEDFNIELNSIEPQIERIFNAKKEQL